MTATAVVMGDVGLLLRFVPHAGKRQQSPSNDKAQSAQWRDRAEPYGATEGESVQ
jgi:hypothetical protein